MIEIIWKTCNFMIGKEYLQIKYKKDRKANEQKTFINRHFPEWIQVVKKNVEKCPTPLLIREMKTQTTVDYQYMHIHQIGKRLKGLPKANAGQSMMRVKSLTL